MPDGKPIDSFDDLYGRGALARFERGLGRLDGLDVDVAEVEPHHLRVSFGAGTVDMTFAGDATTFFSYTGVGALGALARAMPAALESIGVRTMTAAPDRNDSRQAFRRIGFEGDGDYMHCPTRRMAEYHAWREEGADEPGWHAAVVRSQAASDHPEEEKP